MVGKPPVCCTAVKLFDVMLRSGRFKTSLAGGRQGSTYARGQASRDSGDDFIRDCADLFGHVFGGDSQPGPFADQNRSLSELDAGNICHSMIGKSMLTRPTFGAIVREGEPALFECRAAQTVGVTYRERGDAAFARGGEGRP